MRFHNITTEEERSVNRVKPPHYLFNMRGRAPRGWSVCINHEEKSSEWNSGRKYVTMHGTPIASFSDKRDALMFAAAKGGGAGRDAKVWYGGRPLKNQDVFQ